MIALHAKKVDFDVTYIDLRDKPDWFLEISPHGKVPVLVVDDQPLFESNAIAEYLDEMIEPRLHPADPIKRARNRAWTDFVPDFGRALNGVYYTKTKEQMAEGLEKAPKALQKLEDALTHERNNDGPYFNGPELSLVDCAYAPFLQRFGIVERTLQSGLLAAFPLVQAWTDALIGNDCVKRSVVADFEDKFVDNLKRRGFYVGSLLEAGRAAAE